MRVLLLLSLVAAVFAAAPRSERMPSRIVGGEAASVEQYPYMSNIQYNYFSSWWTQWCGGSLITSSTVVSAAHCFVIPDRPFLFAVRLGSSFASSGGTVHGASQLIIHEGYNGATIEHDVAIVRLATPATLSSSVAVVPIAGPNYLMADGTPVTTVGWGSLVSGGTGPEQLQHVEINIINQELCYQRYLTRPTLPDVTDGMICAGILDIGGKDACQGDSGGPLVHKVNEHVLVGIVSWGYGCADAFLPGVNARVSSYTDWIVANGST